MGQNNRIFNLNQMPQTPLSNQQYLASSVQGPSPPGSTNPQNLARPQGEY
jgi:hypothetical protein